MDKLRGIGQFILLLVVMFLPLQAQATIPAGPKDAGKPQDAGKPVSAPRPSHKIHQVDLNDLEEAGLEDCHVNILKKISYRWNYSGPGLTASHNDTCDNEFFTDCMQVWAQSGIQDDKSTIREIFEKDRTAAQSIGKGHCFPSPVWGTPDECAYMHDMSYKRAGLAKEHADKAKIEGNKQGYIHSMSVYHGIISEADFKLDKCVSEFTDLFGARRIEYFKLSYMDQKYADSMDLIFGFKGTWHEGWEDIYYTQSELDKKFGKAGLAPSTLVNNSLNQANNSIIKNLKLTELFNIPTLDIYYSGSGGGGW